MFDFNNLIGLKKEEAIKILSGSGYNNIEIIMNSKKNEQTDSELVLQAKQQENRVVLILGEFCLDIKG